MDAEDFIDCFSDRIVAWALYEADTNSVVYSIADSEWATKSSGGWRRLNEAGFRDTATTCPGCTLGRFLPVLVSGL